MYHSLFLYSSKPTIIAKTIVCRSRIVILRLRRLFYILDLLSHKEIDNRTYRNTYGNVDGGVYDVTRNARNVQNKCQHSEETPAALK